MGPHALQVRLVSTTRPYINPPVLLCRPHLIQPAHTYPHNDHYTLNISLIYNLIHHHGEPLLPLRGVCQVLMMTSQGAIFSAIGGAINAVVSAIASIIMIIVSVIVTVRTSMIFGGPNSRFCWQIIVTIFDIIFDILCCNCFGGRTRRTGTHRYRFGRRSAAATY